MLPEQIKIQINVKTQMKNPNRFGKHIRTMEFVYPKGLMQ